MEEQNNQGQLNIELPEEVADGTYSNLAIITHSNAEFVVDFIRVMPGMPKARVKSRVLLTPQHAKRLMRALQDNINKFVKRVRPAAHTDITGGILQASEYLNEKAPGEKVILVFSDLKEELAKAAWLRRELANEPGSPG